MSVNRAQFPATIWDGTSPTRRTRLTDRFSENEDHDQIVAELIATQEYVKNTPAGVVPYEAEADSVCENGSPLYVLANGHVDLAQANHPAMAAVRGFATAAANPGFSVSYVSEGAIERDDWTSITGTALLTPGSTYYLDPDNPGKMLTTAPSASGDFVAKLGSAVSTTEFDIEITQTIRL